METAYIFNFLRTVVFVLGGCYLPFLFFTTWCSTFEPQVVLLLQPPMAVNVSLDWNPAGLHPSPERRDSLKVTSKLLRRHVQMRGLLPEQCEALGSATGEGAMSWVGCSFPTPKKRLHQCLRSKGIKRIVIIGDSQGKKFGIALGTMLGHAMKMICGSDSNLGLRKFVNETMTEAEAELLKTTFNTTCPSCHGFTTKCRDISIEHIGLTFIDQATITIPPREKTYMDFLLKVYLKKYPLDMLILYPPYNHMKREEFVFESFREQLPRVLKMMKTSLDGAKSFVILSGLSEHESARKTNNKYYMYKYFGALANDRIYALTSELGHILQEQKTLQDPRFSAFVNLNNATRNLSAYCLDGIHYYGIYALVLETLFGVLCSSWGF